MKDTKFTFKLYYNVAGHLSYFLQIANILECETQVLHTTQCNNILCNTTMYYSEIGIKGKMSNIVKLQKIYDEIGKLYGAKINA